MIAEAFNYYIALCDGNPAAATFITGGTLIIFCGVLWMFFSEECPQTK